MYNFVIYIAYIRWAMGMYMLSFNIRDFVMLIIAGWIYESNRPVHKVHRAVSWPSRALHKPCFVLLTN